MCPEICSLFCCSVPRGWGGDLPEKDRVILEKRVGLILLSLEGILRCKKCFCVTDQY